MQLETRAVGLTVLLISVFLTVAAFAHGQGPDALLQIVEDYCDLTGDDAVIKRVGDWIFRTIVQSVFQRTPSNSDLNMVSCLLVEPHCHPEAMVFLGDMFREGRNVKQDYGEAFSLYQRAADLGSIEALVRLGVMFFSGLGVEQNYEEAFDSYKHAATSGNASGQLLLGSMYSSGCGGPMQNFVEAHAWLNIASKEIPDHASAPRDKIASRMSATAIEKAQERAEVLKDEIGEEQRRRNQAATKCVEQCEKATGLSATLFGWETGGTAAAS